MIFFCDGNGSVGVTKHHHPEVSAWHSWCIPQITQYNDSIRLISGVQAWLRRTEQVVLGVISNAAAIGHFWSCKFYSDWKPP